MKTSRSAHTRRGIMLVLASALLLVAGIACDPEDYGPCTLPRSEALNEACEASHSDGDETTPATDSSPNCVVDFVFECESQLCGTYNGSDPFCTSRCNDAADTACPKGGACLEWVPGLGEFFCVPPELAPPVI